MYTSSSDLFASMNQAGVNVLIQHIMRQRPSLFNFATAYFKWHIDDLCVPIEASDEVIEKGYPLFHTVESPLEIPGMVSPRGLHYCLQLTDAEFDFHPADIINLPDQIAPLNNQRFALRLRGHLGIDCPDTETMDRYIELMELLAVQNNETVVNLDDEEDSTRTLAARIDPNAGDYTDAEQASAPGQVEGAVAIGMWPLPFSGLQCFSLELFAEGAFEWGTVGSDAKQWLKPRLKQIEVVDLGQDDLEDLFECFLKTVLKLSVFPRLMLPMEKLILDITSLLADKDLILNEQVSLEPSRVPQDVEHNPAVEDNQLKAYIRLVVK